jgi:hypothetical protein
MWVTQRTGQVFTDHLVAAGGASLRCVTDASGDDKSDGENKTSGGWVGFHGDKHGMPASEGNDHLSADQRAALEELAADRAEARGRHQATIVVYVYENGEATPHVQFPHESTLDMHDRTKVNDAVAKAAEALRNWK